MSQLNDLVEKLKKIKNEVIKNFKVINGRINAADRLKAKAPQYSLIEFDISLFLKNDLKNKLTRIIKSHADLSKKFELYIINYKAEDYKKNNDSIQNYILDRYTKSIIPNSENKIYEIQSEIDDLNSNIKDEYDKSKLIKMNDDLTKLEIDLFNKSSLHKQIVKKFEKLRDKLSVQLNDCVRTSNKQSYDKILNAIKSDFVESIKNFYIISNNFDPLKK